MRDVVLELDRSRMPPSPQLKACVGVLCKKSPRTRPKDFVPPARIFVLEFVSRGRIFVPTPSPRKLIEQWDTETPDQLKRAFPPALD